MQKSQVVLPCVDFALVLALAFAFGLALVLVGFGLYLLRMVVIVRLYRSGLVPVELVDLFVHAEFVFEKTTC